LIEWILKVKIAIRAGMIDNTAPLILVVEDIEETRDGIERLLKADGYRVDPARDENDAIARASRAHPDLILVSLPGTAADMVVMASRIREHAGMTDSVPVVIFCVDSVAEGAEVESERKIYLTRPDNFDQLRRFMMRLLALRSATV